MEFKATPLTLSGSASFSVSIKYGMVQTIFFKKSYALLSGCRKISCVLVVVVVVVVVLLLFHDDYYVLYERSE